MLLLPEQKKKIIYWSVTTVVPLAFILPLYFFSPLGLSECFLVPGILYLAICALVMINRSGMFDIFNYQFINLMSSFRPGSPKKYKTAGDYSLMVKEKRHHNKFYYLPFIVYGVLYLALAILVALLVTK